jgi:hypothetical protein
LLATIAFAAICPVVGDAQDLSQKTDPLQASIQTLQTQTSELKTMVEEMRAEMLRSRAEAAALREELQATRAQLDAVAGRQKNTSTANSEQATPDLQQQVEKLQEDQELLNAKVEQQNQTKVESASKYRVRLSGMALMNAFSNSGTVDNIDFPSLALADNSAFYRGSVGGSFRQSMIGLETFGPELHGGRISADLQFDFAGGFPNANDGVTFGIARLRTGTVKLTFPKTTLVAGQDSLFFSPLAPSSIASVAVPAFGYSGNLWSWTPQIRIEHQFDFSEDSSVLLQGGILDPLTGEPPASSFYRTPQAGEASRQPAYAFRTSWSHNISDRAVVIGGAGYYSRQDWGFHRDTDSWAAMSDWLVPLPARLEFSGEFYRGRAIGGLGGGIGRTVLTSGPITDPLTQVKGLNAEGGWSQLKFRQTAKLEWNGAIGMDTVPAKDLHTLPFSPTSYAYSPIARNRSGILNFIYRPRSDLLVSGEFHPLRTFTVRGNTYKSNLISLSMGVLF